MIERPVRAPLWRFAAELFIWYGAAAVFLGAYVHVFAGPWSAVRPHLALLTSLLAVIFGLRLLAWRCLRGALLPRVFCGVLLTTMLALVLAYYALVLIGLHNWARVISWNLVWSYAGQVSELFQALGSSMAVVLGALALALAALGLLIDRGLIRHDWTLALAQRLPPTVMAGVVAGSLGLGGIQLFHYAVAPPSQSDEPVTLTLFPELASRKGQNNSTTTSTPLALAAEADRRTYVPAPAARRRNVVIVVSDALRVENMGVYGYARDTTPFLSSLAAAGQLQMHPRMSSACAESWCGLLALARSKYLHQMSSSDMSLHEALRKHGYRVHMVLGGDHTNFYGLREAYGGVDSYVDGSMVKGFYMNDDRLVLHEAAKLPTWDGQPTLLQFHLMSSHPLGTHEVQPVKFSPSEPYLAIKPRSFVIPTRPTELATNHYDNGVVQADEMLRRLVDQLQAKGYLSDALVILTADHGEMLGEHAQFGHSQNVYQPSLHIPFVMLQFGASGSSGPWHQAAASQVDIAPTVLAELGMPIPSTWSGRPVSRPPQARQLFFQQRRFAGVYETEPDGMLLKYWRDGATGAEFAYDMVHDAAEAHNLMSGLDETTLRRLRLAVMPIAASMTH